MNLKRFFRSDISTAALILANIVTIIVAVVQKWNVADVLWLYLAQSFIIGCFAFLRILELKQFSTKGILIKGKPNQWSRQVEPTLAIKREMARGILLFTIIWNGFYAVFLYLIFGIPSLQGPPATGFAICILIFFINHLFSHLYNRSRDRQRKPNIGKISWLVVARIIPMHMTLLLGGWLVSDNSKESMNGSATVLVLFLIIKTIVDVMMHNSEHSADEQDEWNDI